MFGSKKFLENGAQIDGVVIESDDSNVYQNQAASYRVKVRATFEDGTSAEFEDKLHTKDAGAKGIGAVVPVRYDRNDRTKIAVDETEIRRRRDLTDSQRKAAYAAPAQALPADPAEALQLMWEQLRDLDYRGSELRRSGAGRDEVGAWVFERQALDDRFRALKNSHPEWKPIRSDDAG